MSVRDRGGGDTIFGLPTALLPSCVRGMSCPGRREEQKQAVGEGEEEQRLLERS